MCVSRCVAVLSGSSSMLPAALAVLSLGWSLPTRAPCHRVPHSHRATGLHATEPGDASSFPQTVAEWQAWSAKAKADPSVGLQLIKDAGVAGAISYTVVELSFFSIALPIGYFGWHASTGEWLQPLLLLQEDGYEGKARVLGLLLSYVVLLKTLFPLRLGSTLLLTPRTAGLLRRLSGSQD
jgi:hypothetical protein